MVLTVLNVAYPFAPVGPDAVGGAEQVLSALDYALVEQGHRSIVIACEGSTAAGELVPVAVESGRLDETARERAWAAYRAAIGEVVHNETVDLVHLHGIDFPAYLPEGVPTLATLHLPLDWYPASIFRPHADLRLHCVSEAQDATRPPGAQLLPPIPNGVSPKLFATTCRKRGHAIVLSRICPEKGIDIALQACRLADTPLLIGGRVFPYAAHECYFEERVRPLLDERRRFLGPLGFDRKRRLLAAARCALIPSLAAETSSLAAIEALACGTPVVALPNGALPSIIEHGKTGFLVRDAREMAEAILAAGDLDSEECRAVAAERFSLETMTARYFDVYRGISRRGREESALEKTG
ncbi:glycosyltransferase family 4 protein [Nitratireductor sp. GCM10026969]|uniref:glycosyltransferase family 4 protein n=1 Tax=Nitratireductor sp. GCM10026969 TaxID=3252645 RepID=UPI00361B85DF